MATGAGSPAILDRLLRHLTISICGENCRLKGWRLKGMLQARNQEGWKPAELLAIRAVAPPKPRRPGVALDSARPVVP